MGVMDKLMFWKREPKLELDPSLDLGPDPAQAPDPLAGMGTDPMSSPNLGLGPSPIAQPSSPPSFQQPMPVEQPRIIHDPLQTPQQIQTDSNDKNLEIISMKLDNLKVAMENVSQRLANIERIAMDSTKEEPKRPQW